MANQSLQQLLSCLADGAVHSGEALGEQLGVSRAAVWKQVRAAQQLGIPLAANKGSGYQLESGFELLDAVRIRQLCSPVTQRSIRDIQVQLSVGSTNTCVLESLRNRQDPVPMVILAEQQTAGRGRRGRSWFSPFGSSIYLTLGWVYDDGVAALEGLSLVIGLGVLRVLADAGFRELQLKWPNDITWRGKKLAGILVDLQGDPEGICQVAVGIGINCNLATIAQVEINQPWTDLKSALPEGVSLPVRNLLVARLLDQLVPTMASMPQRGFAFYQQEWQRYDSCLDQPVTLHAGNSAQHGRGIGVNTHGAYGIRLEGSDNNIVYASGGEISLRLAAAHDSGRDA